MSADSYKSPGVKPRRTRILSRLVGTLGLLFRLEHSSNIPHGFAPILGAVFCFIVATLLSSQKESRDYKRQTVFAVLAVESVVCLIQYASHWQNGIA